MNKAQHKVMRLFNVVKSRVAPKCSLGLFGIVLSLLYLFTVYGFALSDGLSQLRTLDLNELGDFLAGAFGPLAIFWLVIGFFQQRQELKQNTEALLLQRSELRNSVEQQKLMVRVAQEQILQQYEWQRQERLDAAEAGNAKLQIEGIEDLQQMMAKEKLVVVIVNLGGDATIRGLEFSNTESCVVTTPENRLVELWRRGSTLHIVLEQPSEAVLVTFWLHSINGTEDRLMGLHVDQNEDGSWVASFSD